MTNLIPFFCVLTVGFCVRFLGLGSVTEGRNILLLGVLILGLNFIFRLFFIRLKKRSRFLLLFYIILILNFVYLYYLRVYLFSWFGLCLSGIFYSIFIFHVLEPLPTPSGSECSVNQAPQAPGGNDAGPSVPSSLTPLPFHSMEENNPSDREQPEGAVEFIDDDQYYKQIRHRMIILSPKRGFTSNDINMIIFLKKEIINLMVELDYHPFWTEQKNHIISEGILKGGKYEYTVKTLYKNWFQLKNEGQSAFFFKQMLKMRKNFDTKGRFY